MAKITTPQNIPSELLKGYQGVLGEERLDEKVHKRYPFRIPPMQTLVGHPSPKQKKQRTRFLIARGNFAKADWPNRQRWYAAMPEWKSFLWYYNYYIMSDLAGNADAEHGGFGVIKSIQFVKEEVPTTGGKAFAINAIDPTKAVVMLFGNSFISDKIQRHYGTMDDNTEKTINLSPNVDPAITEVIVRGGGGYEDIVDGSGEGFWGDITCSYLSASQVKIKLTQLESFKVFPYSVELVEHKAQTIYPVIVSIAAESVNIDWSKVPSVAADITIIAIEYI